MRGPIICPIVLGDENTVWLDASSTTWIEPVLYCEVQYASVTPNGTLREPVFVRMRPDL